MRGWIDSMTPVGVVHIYPHYLLEGCKTNFARTYSPFWDMLAFFFFFGPPSALKSDTVRSLETDPTRQGNSILSKI